MTIKDDPLSGLRTITHDDGSIETLEWVAGLGWVLI